MIENTCILFFKYLLKLQFASSIFVENIFHVLVKNVYFWWARYISLMDYIGWKIDNIFAETW